VFDDPATDLKQEPFVEDIPEMIDDLVGHSAKVSGTYCGMAHGHALDTTIRIGADVRKVPAPLCLPPRNVRDPFNLPPSANEACQST
jgi:hypothetical protein